MALQRWNSREVFDYREVVCLSLQGSILAEVCILPFLCVSSMYISLVHPSWRPLLSRVSEEKAMMRVLSVCAIFIFGALANTSNTAKTTLARILSEVRDICAPTRRSFVCFASDGLGMLSLLKSGG